MAVDARLAKASATGVTQSSWGGLLASHGSVSPFVLCPELEISTTASQRKEPNFLRHFIRHFIHHFIQHFTFHCRQAIRPSHTMHVLFSSVLALLLVVLMGRVHDASAQGGGYVVRGPVKVINGNTVRVSGVDVTLSGVATVKKYDASAARSLKKRIGNKQVGCMVDGSWSGKNWGYCT